MRKLFTHPAAICIALLAAVLLGVAVFVHWYEPDARQPGGGDPVAPSIDATPAGSLRGTWLGKDVADWRPPLVLAQLSAAVYDGEDAFAAKAAALGFDPASVRWIGSGHLRAAVVSTGPRDGRVTVAVFRGTSTFREALDDLDFVGRPLGPWSVHKGFLNALVAVEDEVAAEVRERDPEHLWATGHSLGGAMAGLFTAKRLRADLSAPQLVTFGQPAFGGRAMVDALNDSLGSRYVRVIYEDDPVARLAPGYHHAGRVVRFRGERQTAFQMPAPGSAGSNEEPPVLITGYTHRLDPPEQPMFTEEEVRALRDAADVPDDPVTIDGKVVAGSAGPPRGGLFLPNAGDHRMTNYVRALQERQPPPSPDITPQSTRREPARRR